MVHKIKSLLKTSNLLLAEQAAISFFQFGLIFVLSKVLHPEVFSQYIVVNSVVILCFLAIQTIITNPSLILSQTKWVDSYSRYFNATLLTTVSLALIIGLPFLASNFTSLNVRLNALFCLISISVYDAIRKRFLYENKNIGLLFVVSSTSVTLTLLMLFLYSTLTISYVFFFQGLFFLFSSAVLMNKISIIKHIKIFVSARFYSKFLKEHYRFSRFLFLGVVFYWGYTSGLYIFLYGILAADEITQLKSAQNLSGIFSVLLVYIDNRYSSDLSRRVELGENTKNQVLMLIKKNAKQTIFISIVSLLAMVFLYQKFYYDSYGSGLFLLIIFFAQQQALLYSKPFTVALKAHKKTAPFLIAHIFSSILAGVFTIIFVFNQTTAAAAFMFSSILFAILIYYYWHHHEKNINH